ncbi:MULTISPECIES: hypothetical protein [unclassified Sphingomonas]|uniref:hypothetical protein n=1 Tax=unclassified Sphingomonas TaxID=196159 RepID=UPI0012E1CE45|nr:MULTISPECIES: hypothetical protein [unclassified Sphingomonas]
MAAAKAPLFDPSRTPPDSLNATKLDHPARSIPVQEARELLGIAWAAYDRARAEERDGLTLRDPACVERCTRCGLECAVILSGLRMAHRDYRDALAAAGPVLSFGGTVYSAMAGRA